MRFENINELGRIKSTEKDIPLFRFEYTSNFYGSCTFLAKVIEGEHRPLRLDEDSVSLQAHTLKKGTLPVLLNVAKIFFRRMLSKYLHLHELETDPVSQ